MTICKFCIAVLLALIASGCTATSVSGNDYCVISVVPLEPTGGMTRIAAETDSKGLAVVVYPTQKVYKSSLEFYDPSGTDLWKQVTSATKFRFQFRDMGSSYDVMLQEDNGWGIWKDVWSDTKNYPWETNGVWDQGSWKVFSASATEAQYLISNDNGNSAGFLLKGKLQDLTL